MTRNEKILGEQLAKLLRGRQAHVSFDDAVKGIPARLRGVRPRGFPHTAWQLVEHMRIAQWDILDFCRNPHYEKMRFPDDYWPATATPPSPREWQQSLRRFRADLQAMERLVRNPKTDLYARIPWGAGQNILREAMVVAGHNAYHIGQLVLLRRALGAW